MAQPKITFSIDRHGEKWYKSPTGATAELIVVSIWNEQGIIHTKTEEEYIKAKYIVNEAIRCGIVCDRELNVNNPK
jgi:hypothetical protein